ncbi:phosphatidylinositol-specific phospholipase C/glycerophosphodiester phosphodiesterase family protein [Streptomyces sp. NPDC015131]|uniref:phosphatidylinositol-specific phospholipase C/glycerophosphodiester phosphodiesterase family protein n=1 Tax=Streptomyces sp. NPDC015131 TaxID=3364941 RepID=UPI0036F4BBED
MAPLSRRSAVLGLAAAPAAALALPAPSATASTAATRGPIATASTAATAGPVATQLCARPLRRAHAHNDYLHPRPLHDALHHGFTSVEADVFLVDGALLVAHDPAGLDPARTLRALYLEPLAARVRAHGSVHPGHHRPVQLLVDIKADGVAAYRALHRELAPYRWMMSRCADGRVRPGAVTAVVSGDRAARAPLEAQRVRYAFYDGRLDDLGTAAPASLVPLVSAAWSSVFGTHGTGPLPPAARARLHRLVAAAHREGRRIRFWGTPDTPGPARDALWAELLAARVDHLNTDDLPGLARFLRMHDE